ncbi:MAG: hypothetical protein M3033_18305 [Acidobacteriota bacterium]|nr:hypothetical protein [Acidobacteriota bacterium]
MSNTLIKQKTPEEARSFFSILGIDTSVLSDEQVKKNLLVITENLSNPSEVEKNKDKETSIDLAYKVAIDYFESSIKRFDAIDSKIQTLFTFAIGVFAIAPTLIKSNVNTKLNTTFWIGMGLLVLSGLISIIARLYGKLNILNPRIIFEKTLDLNTNDFKKSVINTAAKAYDNNSQVIETKHNLNVTSMMVFGVALLFLVYWLVVFAV